MQASCCLSLTPIAWPVNELCENMSPKAVTHNCNRIADVENSDGGVSIWYRSLREHSLTYGNDLSDVLSFVVQWGTKEKAEIDLILSSRLAAQDSDYNANR
jgi:hypothetical protein